MALGCSDGLVFILNHKTRAQFTLDAAPLLTKGGTGSTRGGGSRDEKQQQQQQVVEIAWDPLSTLYLLVAYQYEVVLWDIERKESINVFEKQNIPISSIAWLDWTAGNFMTTNQKNGVVRIWNASQVLPLESRKILDTGIFNIVFEGGSSKRAVIACRVASVF